MKLCRFQLASGGSARAGLCVNDLEVTDLTAAGISSLTPLLESPRLGEVLAELAGQDPPRHPLSAVKLLCPIERQEVWAAGVTYLRSKAARMEESDFSATAYDRVYAAARPELFFKSMPGKVAGPEEYVGIRADARWNVPEPELALVFNSRRQLVGCTIGNDMSSRDIEGENLLYLPQAKIYRHSCALGPWIATGIAESQARDWTIRLEIRRGDGLVFAGDTEINNIKRSFVELADYLFRCQDFPDGAVLLTGTGIVPKEDFTLQPGDVVTIQISGIGTLANVVQIVD